MSESELDINKCMKKVDISWMIFSILVPILSLSLSAVN